MKRRAELLLLTACSLGLSLPLGSQARREGDIALVANPDVPVENLPLYEVRHIFMGDKQYWKRNLPVVLIVPPPGTHEFDVMLHTLFHMNQSQYTHYWTNRILSAQPIPSPKTAQSSDLATDLASSQHGCITIVGAGHIRRGNKVIRVDGFMPGEKGYPLR